MLTDVRRSIWVPVVLSFVSSFLQGAASGAVVYNLTDLGTLGGTSSYGTAINDHGTAVGYITFPGSHPSGLQRAFISTAEAGTQIIGSVVEEVDSAAFDINNHEHVVGFTDIFTTFYEFKPFRWTSSSGVVVMELPITTGGSQQGMARDLNENDEAIGDQSFGITNRAAKWSDTNVATLAFPSAPYSLGDTQGTAINDNGEFVASFGLGDGLFSSASSVHILPSFLPTDLNNSREIVGSSGGIAAHLDFDSNTTTLLGKLSLTDTSSRALGISESGIIVGVSEGTGAFIYESANGLGNLTTMLAADFTGWTILVAEDINNKGQIVGQGRFNGVDHAVILTPVPEPNGAALSLVPCILFALQRVRLRQRY